MNFFLRSLLGGCVFLSVFAAACSTDGAGNTRLSPSGPPATASSGSPSTTTQTPRRSPQTPTPSPAPPVIDFGQAPVELITVLPGDGKSSQVAGAKLFVDLDRSEFDYTLDPLLYAQAGGRAAKFSFNNELTLALDNQFVNIRKVGCQQERRLFDDYSEDVIVSCDVEVRIVADAPELTLVPRKISRSVTFNEKAIGPGPRRPALVQTGAFGERVDIRVRGLSWTSLAPEAYELVPGFSGEVDVITDFGVVNFIFSVHENAGTKGAQEVAVIGPHLVRLTVAEFCFGICLGTAQVILAFDVELTALTQEPVPARVIDLRD